MNVASLSPWHDAPRGSEMPRDTDVQPLETPAFFFVSSHALLGCSFKNKGIQSVAIGGDGDGA